MSRRLVASWAENDTPGFWWNMLRPSIGSVRWLDECKSMLMEGEAFALTRLEHVIIAWETRFSQLKRSRIESSHPNLPLKEKKYWYTDGTYIRDTESDLDLSTLRSEV